MKKFMSAFLSAAFLISAIPAGFAEAQETADIYFTDMRSVDYREWTENNLQDLGGASTNGDAAYKFTVGDENFSLLDVKNDSSSKYFVISNSGYGYKMFYNNGQEQWFKVLSDEELSEVGAANAVEYYPGWWIQSGEFKNGSGIWGQSCNTRIASNIREYIDNNHIWTCESASKAAAPSAEYKIKAGITLPSASEIQAYKDRFGICDTPSFATRTVISYNDGSGSRFFGVAQAWPSHDVNGIAWYPTQTPMGNGAFVRPVFWLNDKFFANVAVDLSTAGEAVKQEIKKIGLETLLNIYSSEELKTYLNLEEDKSGIYGAKIVTESGNAPEYGDTLTIDYQLNSDYIAKSENITWKKEDEGKIVTLGLGKEYIVTEADAATGKAKIYYDLVVEAADGSILKAASKSVTIPSLGVAPIAVNSWKPIRANASDANKFIVDGKSFTLVDSFANDRSTYFVAANDNYGRFTVSSSVQMNPDNVNNYAYWMNTDFRKNGIMNGDSVMKMPESIVNYIDNEHIWLTEGAPENYEAKQRPTSGLNNENYTFSAGIVPISMSELFRYNEVLGAKERIGSYYTRTAANYDDGSNAPLLYNANSYLESSMNINIVQANPWNLTENGIRPVFYLTKDFFKNVALDWNYIGENVLQIMRDNYYIEDLKDIYDEEVLADNDFKYRAKLEVSYSPFANPSETLATLEGAESLQANIILTTIETGIDAEVFLALYDGNDKLKRIVKGSLYSDGSTASTAVGFESLSGITAAYKAKVMVWDRLTSMKPICAAETFDTIANLKYATKVSNIYSETTGNNFF